jgi:DNA-binding protein YbaB
MEGLADLKNLMEVAQRIQAEVARVKEELAGKTVEAESGGGLVRCVASGAGEIVELTIDPSLFSVGGSRGGSDDGSADRSAADRKMLEDLVVGAVNLALERARELARGEMARVTGGLALPPGLLGG